MGIINVIKLTEHLSQNPDAVIDILTNIGFDKIQYNAAKRQFRLARAEGTNPTSIIMNLDSLQFFCFSTNEKGNLYTLIMDRKNISFPEALKLAAKTAGISVTSLSQSVKLPFKGFYKDIIRSVSEPETIMQTYTDSILKNYLQAPNMMFLRDGISLDVQSEYEIGYDVETNRITVPIRTFKGELCGIMGRLNDSDCEHEERWLPIIPCSRSLTLFGYHRNYRAIQEKQLCIIGESEKFPMQAASMGCNVALATSGCHISDTQARYIKALMVKNIIVAYDEGLDEEFVREQAEKLCVNNSIYQNRVGYIRDKDNEILTKGGKQAITDLGKDKFAYAINHCVRWLK